MAHRLHLEPRTGGQQSLSWSETPRLSVGLRGLSWSETPRLSVGLRGFSWSETPRLSVGLRGFSWSETPRLSVGLRGFSWSETPRLSVGLRVQVRQRVAGDGPRTDQNNDGKGSSVCVSGSWSCGCLVLPGVGCWVAVSGALASSLVVGCCPCLPSSGFCAGFREKGRRPKNRSRHPFARAGLFQVFPGMLAVLERRYRGLFLRWYIWWVIPPPHIFVDL